MTEQKTRIRAKSLKGKKVKRPGLSLPAQLCDEWKTFGEQGGLSLSEVVTNHLQAFSIIKDHSPAEMVAILLDLYSGNTRLLVKIGSTGAMQVTGDKIHEMYGTGTKKMVDSTLDPLTIDWSKVEEDY